MGKVKFRVGDRVTANNTASGDYRGREGTIAEHVRGRVEYGVRFDGEAVVEYQNSWWLDSDGPPSSPGVTSPRNNL